jgi:membrane-associated protein
MMLISVINFLNEFRGFLLSVFDPETMIRYGGLLIIFLAVYAQTGLFFCFFLPSGIFLFTGGMFVATGSLQHNLLTVCSCLIIASVLGCFTGYWFGRKTGPLLYKKKDSRFFRQEHLRAAESFYKKYGQLALTIGLLFPIIRTFAPIVAGMIRMNFSRFVLLVFIGSLLWIPPFVLAGYLIGSIPALKEYLPYLMITIILVVTIPVVIRIIKELKKAGKGNDGKS